MRFTRAAMVAALAARFDAVAILVLPVKYASRNSSCQRRGDSTMDLKELRKLPMPKLRDVAKQETELKNAGALEKEELIKAIAAARNVPYDETHKDLNAIHAVKQDIRELQKRKNELLTANGKRNEI